MAQDELRTTLGSLGLNDKEVAIYLTLLQSGTSPASILGDKTGITRSTAQYTCQQLQKKRLATMTKKANTFLYTAEPPEKLLYMIHAEQEELDRKENRVNRVVNTLRAMASPEGLLPQVRYYEGIEAVADAYNDLLKDLSKGDEILSYARPLEQEITAEEVPKVIQNFIEKRIKNGISIRIISSNGSITQKIKEKDEEQLRETLIVDAKDFQTFPEWPVEISFSNNKLCAISIENAHYFAVILQHTTIVKLQRAMFELAWKEHTR